MSTAAPPRTARAARPARPARAGSPRPAAGPWWERLLADRFSSPVTSYYLLLGATLVLVTFGLVMVLSSSSVESYRLSGSSYAMFSRQALFAAVGMPLLWAASRLPVRVWKALGWPLLGGALAAQLLVFTPLGDEVGGNRNWLQLGPVTVQPSEAAKLALVVWVAAVLARKERHLDRLPHLLVPVLPFTGLVLLLVLAGRDLGTALVLMGVVAGMLFVAGAPLRLFLLAGAVAGATVAVLVASSANRMGRIVAWIGGGCDDPDAYYGTCWQTVHGTWALASGGWWGLGLGASREKWEWLPEAHNDFIFAIIGEELGLPGTLVVLALLAALALGCARVVTRSQDLFVKVATAGVLVWVVGQALVNIGAVLGVLPVVGVPLPLISSGGSALVTTLVALGMVLSFARAEPGAGEVLAARPSLLRRSLAVVPASLTQRLPGRLGGRGALR